jgi:hypothetical protein
MDYYETFKDKVADNVRPNIETLMIPVKNEPMVFLVQVRENDTNHA